MDRTAYCLLPQASSSRMARGRGWPQASSLTAEPSHLARVGALPLPAKASRRLGLPPRGVIGYQYLSPSSSSRLYRRPGLAPRAGLAGVGFKTVERARRAGGENSPLKPSASTADHIRRGGRTHAGACAAGRGSVWAGALSRGGGWAWCRWRTKRGVNILLDTFKKFVLIAATDLG